MSNSPSKPHAAYIEDYNEDAHTTVPESRQTANVAAKRSKPEISTIKTKGAGRDGASDSGYSSHTAATLNSRDSSLGSKTGSATLTLDTSLESLAASKRRPTITQRQSQTIPQSPLKQPLRRSESRTRPQEGMRQGSCKCDECQAKAKPRVLRPTVTPQGPSSNGVDQANQKPSAIDNKSPTSKNEQRSAQRATADAPILQPAQPRPRQPGSQSYRTTPRPVSFHGGIMPQPMFYQPIFAGRPTPAFTTHSPFPPPSYPPPTTSYFPPPYQHPPPPAPNQPSPTLQRELYSIPHSPYSVPPQPQPRQWPIEQHPLPRQPITYSAPPIVEYPHVSQYSGGSHSAVHRTFSERARERPVPLQEEYFPFDEDYYRMPPPPPPPPKPPNPSLPRPSIRHAATTAARVSYPENRLAEDYMDEEQARRSPRKYSGENYEKVARPPSTTKHLNTRGGDGAHGADRLEHNFSQMSVEANNAAVKQRRRMTYYGGPIKDYERQAEDYQAHKTVNADAKTIPLTADSLKLVRHKTQTSNSDTGSRASGEGRASREGSDVKPRSTIGRTSSSEIKTRNDDGFTMRFNTSQGVNVDLKGGAKDRTISLRQSREGEGNMELSIKGKNEAREKSRRRQSYIDGTTVRELESIRTASRMGRSSRETDGERLKDRPAIASQSRRSSRNRRAIME